MMFVDQEPAMLTEEQILEIFTRRGVLKKGHFVLSSLRHSDTYYDLKTGLCPYPQDLARLSADIAKLAEPFRPEVFIGPAIGGVALAHHVAFQYNESNRTSIPSCYANKLFGRYSFSIKRGFDELIRGRRVLVVDDDLKARRSSELTTAVRACGGEVISLAGYYSTADISPLHCDAPSLFACGGGEEIDWTDPYDVLGNGMRIAEHYKGEQIDVVLGPAINGLLIAQQAASHLQLINGGEVISVFAEPESVGEMLHIPTEFVPLIAGKRVCLVEDVITTGKSSRFAISATRECGGNIVCEIAICIRGDVTAASLGIPELKAAIEVRNVESWALGECPQWLMDIPVNPDVGHGREYLTKLAAQQPQP